MPMAESAAALGEDGPRQSASTMTSAFMKSSQSPSVPAAPLLQAAA